MSRQSLASFNYVRPTRQRGYILIMTIAALALLALAGAYVGQQVSTAVRLAIAEQTLAEEEKLARDTMANMMYVVGTTKRTALGLGGDMQAIRMDGRWYRVGKDMAISIQDGRGLVNLATTSRVVQERLLESFGVPPEKTSNLLDALEDYEDNDTLRRLSGAESEEYVSAQMLPPRNQALISPHELKRIYGWLRQPTLWGADDILQHTIIAEDTGVNPATATWRTLVAMLGISEREARAFISAREDADAQGMAQLSQPFFGEFSGADLLRLQKPVLFPSATTVITVNRIGSFRAWRSTLTLTPTQNRGAWRVRDYHALSLPQPLDIAALKPLPDVTAYKAKLPTPDDIKLPF